MRRRRQGERDRIAGAHLGQPWARTREQSLSVARELLLDITRDAEVVEALAEWVCKGAARRFREVRAERLR